MIHLERGSKGAGRKDRIPSAPYFKEIMKEKMLSKLYVMYF